MRKNWKVVCLICVTHKMDKKMTLNIFVLVPIFLLDGYIYGPLPITR